jgi:hypothetical protein
LKKADELINISSAGWMAVSSFLPFRYETKGATQLQASRSYCPQLYSQPLKANYNYIFQLEGLCRRIVGWVSVCLNFLFLTKFYIF